jgi:hypothetical protein
MDWFPEEPPTAERAVAASALRYEDVSQDGRLMLLALPHAIGDVVWRTQLIHHPVTRVAHAGILPILSRFVVEGGSGPVSVRWPLEAHGCFQLAHTASDDGAVNRIVLNMWTSLIGPIGRTNGPPPEHAGEPVHVGRVFAEHVFTRPFAPPESRKVLALEAEGLPRVPPDRYSWRPTDALLALPHAARPLDEALVPDEAPVAFGLNHTDSNQHVNSLVYPRLFQDAALRRFATHGRSTKLLAQRLEIAYRKPCFAGDRARIVLRAYEDGERLGAIGAFLLDGSDRPACTIHMSFGT